jgi:lysozyme
MISKELTEHLKFEEGIRLKMYPCTKGKRTIGIGHNMDARPFFPGTRKKIPDTITVDQALLLFREDTDDLLFDMALHWSYIKELSPVRRDAILNMAFQLGCSRLMGFKKMLKALEMGNYQEAHDQALDSNWHKQTPARAKRVAGQFTTNQYYKVPTK